MEWSSEKYKLRLLELQKQIDSLKSRLETIANDITEYIGIADCIKIVYAENEDYHFLRQDSNKFWSHKPGARKVTNLDASKKLIYDPALADYNYKKNANGYLNYDTFCSYMCVPRITPVRVKTGGRRKTKKLKN